MTYSLRLTAKQHVALRRHLFPGDGNEAAALLLCGRRWGEERRTFTVRDVVPIPYEVCAVRTSRRVTWPTDVLDDLVLRFYGRRQAIIKVHSHPGDFREYSSADDESDRSVLGSVASLLGDGLPHASLVMLPSGECFGRVVEGDVIGDSLSNITITGDDLTIWRSSPVPHADAFTLRQRQAFGAGTVDLLRQMSVAVVGCSGTGSLVAEQLARLGVGRLVLIDPKVIEDKHLSRILNSCQDDVRRRRYKVDVVGDAIARIGLRNEVIPLPVDLATPAAVLAVAECDAAFGCMDGVEGRHLLNRITTFYSLPYFDVGVRLDADGAGGIANIVGAVHYLQPGRSSLLSRGMYTLPQVEAEELRRTNPDMYRRHRDEGYLRGIDEDRPAVVSVNMFFASLAVNEFLARVHPYRNLANGEYAAVNGNLAESALFREAERDFEPCALLESHVGRGDVEPLLMRPALS